MDVLFELINPDDMHAALTVLRRTSRRVRKGSESAGLLCG